ncbi:MAG TPA: ABC transporter permease [Gemmatimonadaceae bacterium]|nr:ABC transporter permease [Gemmatimonadaceae bacterium]
MNPFARFEWIVAFRFMREGLTQTLLIIFGVALGGGVIIFMSALLAGLQSNIVRRTLNYQAPIQILAPDQVARPLRAGETAVAAQVQPRSQRLRSVDQWQKIRAEVERIPDVIGVTPVVAGPGFARRGEATKAVSIIGIEFESYFSVIALPEKIIAGRYDVGPIDIVIGTELAKDLGVAVGDKLGLATANGAASTLTVVGIFDFGNKGVNERNVYVALRTAQNLLDLAGGATSIEVKVRDPFAAETIAQSIRESGDLRVDSWIRTNAQFFTAMAAQILANTLIRVFVGLTVALGIASVLVVSVVQKSKEIGILRAMGTARAQILRVFLIQGGFMGLVGAMFGSALAWGFLLLWRGVATNPDGTPMFVIVIEPSLFALACAGATLVGILAAVVPARRAARLDPAVAIHG